KEISSWPTKCGRFSVHCKLLITLFSFELSYVDVVLVIVVAICTGMSKTGVHGAGMLAVPLLANVFGGQLSSGIMLPLLVMADVMGVWYYHRHASWKHLKVLFPWAAAGVIIGTIVGQYIDDKAFRAIMAIIILVSVAVMVLLERIDKEKIPHQKSFAATTGILGGFTSMVGNLAGTVMAVYLLSMRLPKNVFIGTTAWFFLVINWFKVPFHIFSWHTITLDIFLLDLSTLPFIILGAVLGIWIVRKLSESMYRWFIIVMTIIAA